MVAIAAALLGLSALVAAGNLGGVLLAVRRRRRGEGGGWSNIPLISLAFGAGAYALAPDALGLWAFLPAAIDPGTWMLLALPLVIARRRRGSGPTP